MINKIKISSIAAEEVADKVNELVAGFNKLEAKQNRIEKVLSETILLATQKQFSFLEKTDNMIGDLRADLRGE